MNICELILYSFIIFPKQLFFISIVVVRFVEPPVLDMKSVLDDSSTKTPLIFVLSPGVVSNLFLFHFIFLLNLASACF